METSEQELCQHAQSLLLWPWVYVIKLWWPTDTPCTFDHLDKKNLARCSSVDCQNSGIMNGSIKLIV